MRVLICGSRNWFDTAAIIRCLRALPEGSTVIHGAAAGADRIAAYYAEALHLDTVAFPADWGRYGRAAGPKRNQQMLDEGRPEQVIAFRRKGPSPGTDDMIRRAQAAGVPVEIVNDGNQRGHQ